MEESAFYMKIWGSADALELCTSTESFCPNRKLSHTVTASVNMCLSNSIFLQTFDDGASVLTKCSVERPQSILNPDEVSNNWLIITSCKKVPHDFCNEGKSDDKMMLVAFEVSNDPSGLILLKKQPDLQSQQISISFRTHSCK